GPRRPRDDGRTARGGDSTRASGAACARVQHRRGDLVGDAARQHLRHRLPLRAGRYREQHHLCAQRARRSDLGDDDDHGCDLRRYRVRHRAQHRCHRLRLGWAAGDLDRRRARVHGDRPATRPRSGGELWGATRHRGRHLADRRARAVEFGELLACRRHGRPRHPDRREQLPERCRIHPGLRQWRTHREHRRGRAVCCSQLCWIRVGGRMRADGDGASSAPEDDGVSAAGSETDEITGKTRGGLLSAIATGLSFGLLALVVLIAVLVIVVPAVINGRALTVLTSSMEPGYPPGTLVVVAPTAPDDIRIGDVLTYQLESGKATLVTHRVIEIGTSTADGTRTFTTKGDNNDIPDADPVQEVQVVGTVLYAIPYLGYVNTAVNGDLRALIVPVIVGGLLVYAVWMVVSSFRDKRKKAQGDGGA